MTVAAAISAVGLNAGDTITISGTVTETAQISINADDDDRGGAGGSSARSTAQTMISAVANHSLSINALRLKPAAPKREAQT
ncbi:MAG: hypothetical protein R3F59_24000 [Myxococcota bacterium]